MSDELELMRQAALTELRRQPVAIAWSREARRVVLVMAGVCVPVMAVALFLPGHANLGAMQWWLAAALLAVVTVMGSVESLRPGGRLGLWLVLGLAVATIPALVLALPETATDAPFSSPECILSELGIAAMPAIALVLALARFAWQPLRAVVAGVSAGAAGLLALHVTCPVTDPSHVLAFHVAPSVVVALVLTVVRSRLRSQSFAP